MNEKERVNHPKHYINGGHEAIDIIRYYCFDIGNAMKYLWRAGLKSEDGLTQIEKEIEDCKKSIWYLRDYILNTIVEKVVYQPVPVHPSGISCEDVSKCYCEEIAHAFNYLWNVGIIINGELVSVPSEKEKISKAIECIQTHIKKITKWNK